MANYNTDKGALGAPGAPSGVYPQVIPFSTANAPGANIPISTVLGIGDTIKLFYIPTPGRLFDYRIDMGDLDGAATILMTLEDGLGNAYQTALTTGQAGGVLVSATAVVATVGQIIYTVPATAFMQLRVTTAGIALAAARIVNGYAWVKHE